MRVVIIINPVSGPPRRGRGSERLRIATRTLERLGVQGEVRLTDHPGHAQDLALAAAVSAADLVIAWGGDGTINEVARALVRRGQGGDPAPDLGIVPGGSGNGLARALAIPFDPALAIARAVRAASRTIDVGELGEHLFFNVAGVGLDAHVAAVVSMRIHHRGLLAYVSASLEHLFRYRGADYAIEVDGRTDRRRAVVVALANSQQYGFGARIAPAARLDDGLLDLVAVDDRRLLGNMVRVPFLFVGRLDRRPGVHTAQIRELTIRSGTPMLFHVDGEALQGTDTLSARVLPGALRLRA